MFMSIILTASALFVGFMGTLFAAAIRSEKLTDRSPAAIMALICLLICVSLAFAAGRS